VDGVRRIIALDDEDPYDEYEDWLDNDEWEKVNGGEEHATERKSYSSVLAGKDDL
jgi:hypothetical protein